MTPYLQAFHAYHSAGEQEIPWPDVIDLHLQRGAVLSLPDAFVIARPVRRAWPDAWHLDLSRVTLPSLADAWHVYAAAGNITSLLALAGRWHVSHVTFQRHGHPRLRRLSIKSFHADNMILPD